MAKAKTLAIIAEEKIVKHIHLMFVIRCNVYFREIVDK